MDASSTPQHPSTTTTGIASALPLLVHLIAPGAVFTAVCGAMAGSESDGYRHTGHNTITTTETLDVCVTCAEAAGVDLCERHGCHKVATRVEVFPGIPSGQIVWCAEHADPEAPAVHEQIVVRDVEVDGPEQARELAAELLAAADRVEQATGHTRTSYAERVVRRVCAAVEASGALDVNQLCSLAAVLGVDVFTLVKDPS